MNGGAPRKEAAWLDERERKELLGIARGYKERGLPISVIVIDFFHCQSRETGGSTRHIGLIRRAW
jgi:hypothetical protein